MQRTVANTIVINNSQVVNKVSEVFIVILKLVEDLTNVATNEIIVQKLKKKHQKKYKI